MTDDKRVIITPEVFLKNIDGLSIFTKIAIIVPFVQKKENTEDCFKNMESFFKESPIVLEGVHHLASAYLKMTPFERERLRKELIVAFHKTLSEEELQVLINWAAKQSLPPTQI